MLGLNSRIRQTKTKPWHFHSVEIEGFKAFMNKVSLDFDSLPMDGLIHLTGINEAEPRLGANATAKSTIWDAMCWCLYGKTTRDLFASKIISWHRKKGDKTSVQLDFSLLGVRYRLFRSQQPNTLAISKLVDGVWKKPKTTDQKELNKLIPLTKFEFLYSVIMPQMGALFIELDPQQKLKIFTDIFNLHKWEELSKHAADEAKVITSNLQHQKAELRHVEGKLESIRSSAELDGHHIWLQEQQRHIATTIASMKNEKKSLHELMAALDSTRNKIADIKVSIKKATVSVDKALRNETLSKQRLDELYERAVAAHSSLFVTAAALKEFKSLGDTCHVCQQGISQKHKKAVVSALQKQHNDQEAQADAADEEYRSMKNTHNKNKETYAECESKLKSLERLLQASRNEASRLRLRTDEHTRNYHRHKDVLNKLKHERSPYKNAAKKIEREIDVLQKEIRARQTATRHLDEQLKCTNYWVKGFKEIRLFVLSDVLSQLEFEIQAVLEHIGLQGWSMQVSVDRVTGSGTVQKGVYVDIRAPSSPASSPIAIEQWSGGETQRLGLAMQFALSNLILHMKGVATNIQVFDEPTSYLSPEGVEDLVEVLKLWADANQRQVWIVDHRELTSASINKRLVLRKTNTGSTISKGDM